MAEILDDQALDTIFREARTQNGWSPQPITEAQIRAIYDVLKFGPTSANMSPARFTWVVSDAAKQQLAPHLSGNNREKSMKASAIVIVAQDLDFPDRAGQLFPHKPEIGQIFAQPGLREETASRNSTLQGAYLIIAARALGWDTGPMSGFNQAGVDAEFFAGTNVKSNFLVSIGKGSGEALFPRLPRLPFEDANQIL